MSVTMGRTDRLNRSRKTASAAERKNAGAPVDIDDVVTAEIVGISRDGAGVGRAGGFTLFVPGALPGETVRARVKSVKARYGYANLLELLKPSPDRVTPPFSRGFDNSGCELLHMDYAAQLRWKRQTVIDCLERIGKFKARSEIAGAKRARDAGDSAAEAGGFGDSSGAEAEGVVRVHPVLGMADPWHYRNNVQVPFGEEGGRLIGGFFARGGHRVVDADVFPLCHPHVEMAVRKVKQIARELGLSGYHAATGKGLLRHLVVRYGFHTDELMVVLVTNGRQIARADELIGLIRREIPGVKSICQNINTARTSVVFGEATQVLWGEEAIYDTIGDIRFAISARSFFQVNPRQTATLYRKVVKYAGLTGNETVIDAYCGIGSISLFLARRAAQVHGVEMVAEAVADARRNALLNGITNARFSAGKAENVIRRWLEEGLAADVVVVDPPRKGCDPALLEAIIAMKPERVVYVSCDPATLARDLRILAAGGFRVVEAQPVDMFPHTVHVECVIGMQRIDS
ncbi:MAG TPA: 23S rRNA (uracil(1939)-C(5))-methyltransferase RlmD [Bacilli bacterium]